MSEAMLGKAISKVIKEKLPEFHDINVVKPPHDERITLCCHDNEEDSFLLDVCWLDVSIEKLIAKSWILHSELTKELQQEENT